MWYSNQHWGKTASLALSAALLAATVSCGKSNKPIANAPDTAKATERSISMATFEPTSTQSQSTTTTAEDTQTTSKTNAAKKNSRKTSQTKTTQPTSSDSSQEAVKPYDGFLGSARSLDGTTVVFSIFTSDLSVKWDENSRTDAETMKDTLDNLWRGTSYLTEQVANFGKTASFIYDWEKDPDLRYTASFDDYLVTEYGDKYDLQRDWVIANIDTEAVKAKYNADNAVYLFFFNTDYSNQVNPWTLGYTNCSAYDVEFCNIYVKFDDVFITPPSTYAHEIMHCFGAHDLYYANAYISQEYVDHCQKTGSNDIMYTVNDGKWIINDFTELDAYYVGLTDHCDEVEKWGLAKSEHLA